MPAPGRPGGTLRLNRSPGQPWFDVRELEFLRSLASPLAEGVQRGLLLGEALDPDRPDAPGLVVMGAGLSVESASPEAERWLDELSGESGRVPAVVLSVASGSAVPALTMDLR